MAQRDDRAQGLLDGKGLKILFVTTKTPLPMNDGHTLRSGNLVSEAARGNEVHLLSFIKNEEEVGQVEKLRRFCASVRLVEVAENRSRVALVITLLRSLVSGRSFLECKYNKKEMRRAICEVLAREKIDLVHLDMLPLGVYLPEVAGYPLVLDEHNVECARVRRQAEAQRGVISRLFYRLQARWLELFERRLAARVSHIIACSDVDAATLRGFAPEVPVTTIPNGVDCDFFTPADGEGEEENLVFVGGLDWYPNLDGLQWFDEEVIPLLLAAHPTLTLHVVGNGTPPGWRHPERIICYGRVDDVRPFMARGRAFIAPLRIGGGTRLKILNAMAARKPVISTTIGAEGLAVTPGTDIFIGDSPEAFAEAVAQCLQSGGGKQIADGGLALVRRRYQWSSIGCDLRRVYAQCTGGES